MIAPHQTLQRVIVRMLYDEQFAQSVYRDPEAALSPLGLGARERSWLLAVDHRAWRHDPMRRKRTLRGLVEELKASSAIALAETGRVAFLDAFFSSAPFHRAVQERGSLLSAYADYLRDAPLRTPQLREVVRLEAMLAACRRSLEVAGGADWKAPPVPAGGPTLVMCAPGVAAGRFSPDALAAIQAVERLLFEISLMPIAMLATDAPRLELPPPGGGEPIPLGLIPTQTGISLVHLEIEMVVALERAARPIPIDEIGRSLAMTLVEDEVLIAAEITDSRNPRSWSDALRAGASPDHRDARPPGTRT